MTFVGNQAIGGSGGPGYTGGSGFGGGFYNGVDSTAAVSDCPLPVTWPRAVPAGREPRAVSALAAPSRMAAAPAFEVAFLYSLAHRPLVSILTWTRRASPSTGSTLILNVAQGGAGGAGANGGNGQGGGGYVLGTTTASIDSTLIVSTLRWAACPARAEPAARARAAASTSTPVPT